MIEKQGNNIFSNLKYGTNSSIDRANAIIFIFANKIAIDNTKCKCDNFSSCNHPSLEKINRLKNGL